MTVLKHYIYNLTILASITALFTIYTANQAIGEEQQYSSKQGNKAISKYNDSSPETTKKFRTISGRGCAGYDYDEGLLASMNNSKTDDLDKVLDSELGHILETVYYQSPEKAAIYSTAVAVASKETQFAQDRCAAIANSEGGNSSAWKAMKNCVVKRVTDVNNKAQVSEAYRFCMNQPLGK